jgi:hypothetical protein
LDIRKWAAGVAMVSLAGGALAQGDDWKAQVLIVGAIAEMHAWIERPAGERGGDAARLRRIPAGMKVYFPVMASGLAPPAAGEVRLTADVTFFAPDGKVIWDRRDCCTAAIRDRPEANTVTLGPVVDLVLEPGDMQGLYTVRATVSDGKRTSTASETFSYLAEGARAVAKPAAPILNMSEPANRPAAQGADKRDCLSQPTPSEVIKCAERK